MVYNETIKLEDKVSDNAKHAARTVDVLSKSLANVQASLVKANALGDTKAFNKLATQHDALKAAIGGVDAALLKEVETAKAAGLAAAATAKVNEANAKAKELAAKAAAVAVEKAAKAEALAITKAAKEKETAEKASSVAVEKAQKAAMDRQKLLAAQTTANMAKVKVAMSMGREAVTAAIGGMKKAFTSLASGDVRGAIEGTTQAVAGIAKMLDLVVPGLGQAVSAIVTIAGGLAGVTAGLVKSGVEFALVTNDVAGEMAAMKKGFTENITAMFKGINIKPFIGEMKGLFEIFDQSKPSGQAMKAAIGGAFNKVFEVLTKVVPMVKHFFLDIVILSLKAYIALKPLIKGIKDFASSAEGAAIINTVLSGLWTMLKVVGVAFGVVVVAALVLWGAMILVSVAVWSAVGAAFGMLSEVSMALGEWIASAATSAYDFISGLVNGITGGAIRVVGAVKGLASQAISAVTSTLKIGSPSRVMMGKGLDTAEGMAVGIEAGADDVHGAASTMATAAAKGASAAPQPAPTTAAKGSGATILVNVQIDGAGKSALEITEEMVAAVFGRMALEAGV